MQFPFSHGDFVTFSDDDSDFYLVFFQKGKETPAPPSGDLERTFFFELTAGETIDSFNKKLNVFLDQRERINRKLRRQTKNLRNLMLKSFSDYSSLDPWLLPPSKKPGESVSYVAFSG